MTDIFSDILSPRALAEAPAVLGATALSHGQLRDAVERMAHVLHRHGVGVRSAVGVALPHGVDNLVAILAHATLGAVSVPINFRATADERAFILANTGSAFLVAPPGAAPDRGLTPVEDLGGAVLYATGADARELYADGDAVVIHTSGSTSRPKGVVLTRASLSANVTAVAQGLELTASDRVVLFTPPSFAYAFSQILTHLWSGGAVLPWPLGLLDISALLAAIDAHRITGLQANPTMFEMLLADDTRVWPAMDTVRYVMSGGQPLFSHLVRRLEARFPSARIANMYGLTENSPRVTFGWLPRPIPERATAWPVGRVIVGTRLRISDADGREVAPGEAGEIEVSGTSLMRGYLHAPAERSADGWFKTRDGGMLEPDGNLSLTGRLDNVFSVGHEKVSPEEIESLLAQLEGIDDVAVSHAPHALLGAATVVVFVSVDDAVTMAAWIRERCTRGLSRAKFPHHVFAVPAVPKTLYGKIDRVALKALAARLVTETPERTDG